MINLIISESISLSENLDNEFCIGSNISDVIYLNENICIDLITISPDEIEVVDSLLVESNYSRSVYDTSEIEDSIIEGEQLLIIHGIEDGINYGPIDVYTVSPTGPLSISGGKDCYPIPTGFSLNNGDYIEINDRLDIEIS